MAVSSVTPGQSGMIDEVEAPPLAYLYQVAGELTGLVLAEEEGRPIRVRLDKVLGQAFGFSERQMRRFRLGESSLEGLARRLTFLENADFVDIFVDAKKLSRRATGEARKALARRISQSA